MQGRDIVAGLRAYIFFVWWPEQSKTHFKWKLCPRHTGIVYFNLTAWNTWIPQPLLSLANWRCTTSRPLTLSCVGLYPAEMLEMFFHFVCFFFCFFALWMQETQQLMYKSSCQTQMLLCCTIVFDRYLLPEWFSHCSRFLLKCSHPTAVHCVCALIVAGFIYVMFFNWACCDLFMPPRIRLAFVSRISAFLFS